MRLKGSANKENVLDIISFLFAGKNIYTCKWSIGSSVQIFTCVDGSILRLVTRFLFLGKGEIQLKRKTNCSSSNCT